MRKFYCLALYDIEGMPKLQDAFSKVGNLYIDLNMELSEFHLMISGWPKAKRIRPEMVRQEIAKHQNIISIEGFFTNDRSESFYFSISGMGSTQSILFLSVPQELESKILLEKFALMLSSECKLNYGYIFEWAGDADPFFYATGVNYVANADIENQQHGENANDRWFNETVLISRGKRYLNNGMFRELYSFNVLNHKHAEILIEGHELREYIRLNGWGEQETLDRGAWAWRVRPEMLGRISDRLRSLNRFI